MDATTGTGGLTVPIVPEFTIERWLSTDEISALDYAAYWNDEREEAEKEWNVLDGDFAKLERYVAATGLAAQLERAIECATRELQAKFGGVGADLGCGNLWAASILASRPDVTRLYCVDYSAHRLTKLGPIVLEHYRVPRDKVVLCLGSFYDIRLPSASLDFVLLSAALHHADRPGALLAQIHRILRPAGVVLVIAEPVARPRHFVKEAVKRVLASPIPPRFRERVFGASLARVLRPNLVDPVLGDHVFSDRQYRRMFAEAGFEARRFRDAGADSQAFVLRRLRG